MRTIGFTDKGQIIELTTNELTDILKRKDKGTWTFLITETKVRMNKTGNPFYNGVTKVSHLNVLLGNDYETRMKNVTGDENFVSQKSSVGEHISKCVLHNDNTGKDYLSYENFDYSKIPNYPKNLIPEPPKYIFNGDEIEKQLFESFMIKSKPRPVKWFSVTIDNIKKCHIDGNQYIVVNPAVETEVGEVNVPIEV